MHEHFGRVWVEERTDSGNIFELEVTGGGESLDVRFEGQGRVKGVADELGLAEECRRRGQNALPSSSRSSRTHKSTGLSRNGHTYISDEEEEDRPRGTNLFGDSHLYSSGHKEASKRKRQKHREEQKKIKSSKPYH
ncbi:unnamed protein product [Ranitomeya imitator]|uniref:Uncharacterized protein n=1 Tax=Ranitomeya imitator TaxID=111125 RepID=A0ABN9MSB3_9NEOB|nr:unnamed protein product [Ranitomeya imitator]